MANQIILHPQQFNLSELLSQFPAGKFMKKIFFQSELRSLENGDAAFGVIAYPAWKKKNKWMIGPKINGTDIGMPDVQPFTPPLAFGNNELLLVSDLSKKQRKKIKKEGKKDSPEAKKAEWQRWIRKILKDKKLAEKSLFLFHGRISENPHLEYNVTLQTDETTLSMVANPSPPAPPQG